MLYIMKKFNKYEIPEEKKLSNSKPLLYSKLLEL